MPPLCSSEDRGPKRAEHLFRGTQQVGGRSESQDGGIPGRSKERQVCRRMGMVSLGSQFWAPPPL